MNPANRCFEQISLLAQATPDDHGSWLSVGIIAAFVALVAIYAFMRRSKNPKFNRREIENPPGDPFATVRKEEEEDALAHARASDQTR